MGQRLKPQELPFWFLWIQNGNLANGEELSKFTGETGQFAGSGGTTYSRKSQGMILGLRFKH